MKIDGIQILKTLFDLKMFIWEQKSKYEESEETQVALEEVNGRIRRKLLEVFDDMEED